MTSNTVRAKVIIRFSFLGEDLGSVRDRWILVLSYSKRLLTVLISMYSLHFYPTFGLRVKSNHSKNILTHLNLCFHIFNSVAWLHFERYRLSSQRLHEDLHFAVTIPMS